MSRIERPDRESGQSLVSKGASNMSLEKVSAFMQALGVAYFFWTAYRAPTSQQATKDFLFAAFLGISLVLLLIKLFRQPPPQKLIQQKSVQQPITASQPVKSAELPKPDTSVKDSDPQLEIKVADLRGRTMSDDPKEQACFDLINRGKQSSARFACIEDFKIGEYLVAFRHFPQPIAPCGNHESIIPHYINKPDGTLCKNHIFTVFSAVCSDLKNPKLYEYVVQIKVTYQDDDRNLFETHCDLVFYPFENANRSLGRPTGTVLETKNHKLRKVAPAHLINWGN